MLDNDEFKMALSELDSKLVFDQCANCQHLKRNGGLDQQQRNMKYGEVLLLIDKTFVDATNSDVIVQDLKNSRGFCALCFQLLRNDSLLDISAESEVYVALFALLSRIAKHRHSGSFFSHPILQLEDSVLVTCSQLLKVLESQAKVFLKIWKGDTSNNSVTEFVETDASVLVARSIMEIAEALTANAAQQVATEGEGECSSSTTGGRAAGPMRPAKALPLPSMDIIHYRYADLPHASRCYAYNNNNNNNCNSSGDTCGYVCSGSSSSSRSFRHISPTKRQRTALNNAPSIEEMLEIERASYVSRMQQYRFEVTDMCTEIAQGKMLHVYYTEAVGRRSSAASNPKQRLTRIAKEMATLSTTLPVEFGSSVFLRVDESRMDLIKALIIGPLGTPYANGCFEFDILLPSDYPHRPPYVTLVTTGRGTVSFHPFFSEDGYICLSLFNTADGPGLDWKPEQSTLLQVVLSIQSLVMVPEPYYTDPAVARCGEKNLAYNKSVMHQCMQWAILEQIKSPSVVFENAIHAHFRNKRLSLKQQMQEWLLEIPSCGKLVEKVEAALHQL